MTGRDGARLAAKGGHSNAPPGNAPGAIQMAKAAPDARVMLNPR